MIETTMVSHGLKAHLLGKACPICDEKKVTTTEMIAPKNTMMKKGRTKKLK